MTVSKAAFLWAIRQQESGGDYHAGNPSGAEGAYQMLASNIPDWSRQALGHSISTSEFLGSPLEQDEIADKILGGMYDKYGPEGAASAWYSGDPNLAGSTASQSGGPSIASYVQEVMSRAASAPAGVSLPLSGGGGGEGAGSALGPGGAASGGGGLLSFPGEITGFFSKGVTDLADMGRFFGAFLLPSTWVRIGAGAGGFLFLILGIVVLGIESAKGS